MRGCGVRAAAGAGAGRGHSRGDAAVGFTPKAATFMHEEQRREGFAPKVATFTDEELAVAWTSALMMT